ncbi:MAG: hypothetical protein JWN25_2855, partial [Verrucomicrobiales bacterium]|nr:hypothetical protein [Verrucomicrobiales bacterium]
IIAAKSGFTFAGYATPEATLHSLLWAASTGDVEKLLACCTPDQVKRFKAKLAGKTEAEVAASLKQISTSMADFKLEKTEPISEDQARLHLTVQPFPGHPHVGHDIQVMQRIDSNWKYAGKYGVDFKED